MHIIRFFSTARRWAPHLVFLAWLLALGAPLSAPPASVASAPPALMQFTAAGHVIGFAPTQVILASLDHALRIEFVGTAGLTPVASGADAAVASDARMMRPAQPLGSMAYRDLWRGVDVEYRASDTSILKSTYTVAPGADAAQIRLRYNVAVELQSDGSLHFPFGRGYLSESAPIAWQEMDGARVPVQVAFRVLETDEVNLKSEIENRKSEIGFRLGEYDSRYPLTIDPNYVWHTFYGGTGSDYCYGVAVDGSSNVYIAGYSYAAWQGDGGANPLHACSSNGDIVVVKLNSAGAYQWHTFYGGTGSDLGYGVAVDGSSNVYIAGFSNAAWQGDGGANPLHAYSSIGGDIVVVKLNSAGAYQWHTFYGGAGDDYGRSVAVDGSSNVFIAGYSNETWQGGGGADPLHAYSFRNDIVVVKLNSAGAYQWHTFYCETYIDEGYGVAVDGSSNVYIAGYSDSTWPWDFTAPLHAYSSGADIVVLKLSSTPSAVTLSSFRAASPTFDLAAWFTDILRRWRR